MRAAYMVCYDIGNPKRWRKIHKLMLAYGEPLQLSVFLCRLSPVEFEEMLERVLGELHRTEDALAVAHLGPQDTSDVQTFGRVVLDGAKRIVVV
jgi:CRISPR-associated protein Cas2